MDRFLLEALDSFTLAEFVPLAHVIGVEDFYNKPLHYLKNINQISAALSGPTFTTQVE